MSPPVADWKRICTADALFGTVNGFTGTADSPDRTANHSNHTETSFHRTANSSRHTANCSNHTVTPSDRTRNSANRTADDSNRMADSSNHTQKPFYRTASPSCHTVNSFYRTAESFYRTGKSFQDTVFGQKDAKNGKNQAFFPSRHARWSKSDSLAAITGRAELLLRFPLSPGKAAALPYQRKVSFYAPKTFHREPREIRERKWWPSARTSRISGLSRFVSPALPLNPQPSTNH